MPYYYYTCPTCGQEMSIYMTFDEYDEKRDKMYCEKCKVKLNRTISNIPIMFKSNGFYNIDSKMDSKEMNKLWNVKDRDPNKE